CKLLVVGSLFFWQWEHPPLAVGTLSRQWECLVHFIPNKKLTSPDQTVSGQTTTGKEISNPFMDDYKLKNDIMNFQQRFDETFSEAWDRFKDLLRKCPHHGFLEFDRTCASNLIVESFKIPKRRNRRHSKQIVEPEFRTIGVTPVATMADMRTISELLEALTKGYGDAIVIPAILAENFELKFGILSLVTSSQFHGFERDDPHSHIC
nr:reverse transcriptase domain-containing protein [Tanacetum cinerariifolium]